MKTVEISLFGKEPIRTYLIEKGLIDVKETVRSWTVQNKNGLFYEGIFTSNRNTLVLKQAPGDLPENSRLGLLNQEGIFFEIAQRYEYISRFIPTFRLYDIDNELLVCDDVSEGLSYEKLYKTHHIGDDELKQLAKWLSHFHRIRLSPPEREKIDNPALEKFYSDKLFGFTSQLETLDLDFLTEIDELKKAINQLKENFTSRKVTPIHGQYFPNNWIISDGEMYVQDFRYFMFGPPELDLGIMTAHLRLAVVSQKKINSCFDYYEDLSLNKTLINAYAGLEMMRTIIGQGENKFIATATQKKTRLKEAGELLLSLNL